MLHTPNALPITPHAMAMELDILPATSYVWIIIIYNSNLGWDTCQGELLEHSAWVNDLSVTKELATAASDYFFEYGMIGTLDMAYPSNQATFGHLLNHNYDIPSILIKYPHSDHKAVRKQYDYKPYIELTKINRWGTLIPRAELEKNLKSVFERIIEKYWNVLERKLS